MACGRRVRPQSPASRLRRGASVQGTDARGGCHGGRGVARQTHGTQRTQGQADVGRDAHRGWSDPARPHEPARRGRAHAGRSRKRRSGPGRGLCVFSGRKPTSVKAKSCAPPAPGSAREGTEGCGQTRGPPRGATWACGHGKPHGDRSAHELRGLTTVREAGPRGQGPGPRLRGDAPTMTDFGVLGGLSAHLSVVFLRLPLRLAAGAKL